MSRNHPAGWALLIWLTVLFLPAELGAKMSAGFDRLLDSVVRIDVRELTFTEGSKHYSAGIGSGVILSQDGLILTNAHVVSPQAVDIAVTLSSLERVHAKFIGWDHWTDLAVLRIDLDELKRRHLKFTHAEFGDSGRLYPGETVYAVGTPHGLTRTVTRGIVSNNRRYFQDQTGVHGYETGMFSTWLQTDAAINPGNSGGPLVTEDGAVIGINSRAYIGADNLAFAIPGDLAKEIMASLVKDGHVTRSYIGVVAAPLQDLETFYSLRQNTGMLVDSVDPGSPAARAGLRAGDIVLSIDGVAVDGRFPEQLPPIAKRIAQAPVGATLHMSVKRGELTKDYSITTEVLESRQGEEWVFEKWGLSVQKVSRAYAREHFLPDSNGMLVTGVQPGYPAALSGVADGDVITKLNQKAIEKLAVAKDVYDAFEKNPDTILVETSRHHRVSLHVIKPQ